MSLFRLSIQHNGYAWTNINKRESKYIVKHCIIKRCLYMMHMYNMINIFVVHDIFVRKKTSIICSQREMLPFELKLFELNGNILT